VHCHIGNGRPMSQEPEDEQGNGYPTESNTFAPDVIEEM
jgi:hypothetical protein